MSAKVKKSKKSKGIVVPKPYTTLCDTKACKKRSVISIKTSTGYKRFCGTHWMESPHSKKPEPPKVKVAKNKKKVRRVKK